MINISKWQKNIAYITILVFIFTITLVSSNLALASQKEFNDIQGHWASETIQQMANLGIISGNPDGTFIPEGQVTRAEFATMLVKTYKLSGSGKLFSDTTSHWAKDYIAMAHANGIVNGYNANNFGPNDPITREQMAVMVVKAAKLQNTASGKTFADSQNISDWAKDAVTTATENNIITGYPDNRFKPKGNATRAEAVVVLNKSINIELVVPPQKEEPIKPDYSLIEKAGNYGPKTGTETVLGNITVKAKDTTLQNLIIKGDLIIAKEVGNGDVTLDNITVQGKTYIRGGGKNSIHINGGKYNEIIIEKTATGSVRIVAVNNQGIIVTIAENASGEEIILQGDIKSVTVKADDVKITTQGETTIGELNVASGLKNVNIELAKDSTIKEMILDSKVAVKGEGVINEARGSKVKEVNFPRTPDKIVAPNTVGSTGGGGSAISTVKVTEISVTGKNGVKSITTKAGTLQMLAGVSPDNATNKEVTWTVENGTGSATINDTGLLKAVKNGTVKVIATAKDGSGVKGQLVVNIFGQEKVAVTGVTLNKNTLTLGNLGAAETLVATVMPENATDKNITWSTSDEKVATVNKNGEVTAVAPGKVIITATTADGNFNASCDVTIAGIILNIPDVSFYLGFGEQQSIVTASVYPNGVVTWNNSNPEVTTIVGEANTITITAKSVGTTTLTASFGEYSATCLVTVRPNVGDYTGTMKILGVFDSLLEDVEVKITNNEGFIKTATSNAEGKFIIKDIPNGQCTISFTKEEYLYPRDSTSSIFITPGNFDMYAPIFMVKALPITFEVIGGNGELTAKVVTIDRDITYKSGSSVQKSDKVVFTAAPEAGYQIKSWTVNDQVLANHTSNTYTIDFISDSTNVTVEFEQVFPFTFVVKDGTNHIQGALITIGKMVIETGDDGKAIFNLPGGHHYFTIEKEGYVKDTGRQVQVPVGGGQVVISLTKEL